MTGTMRLGVFTLCAGLGLSACAGQRCLERDEITIEDQTGLAEDRVLEAVGAQTDQFFADTETTCLPLRKIVLTTDLTMGRGYDDDFEPAGKYQSGRDRIRIEVTQALNGHTLIHELCHALDDLEGHSSKDGNPFERVGDETITGYPESLQEREIFARACDGGPMAPHELAVAEVWNLDLDPRLAYLRDEVFTGVTPAEVEVDLLDHIDLLGEAAPLPAEALIHAASPGRLDVVVQSEEAMELVRFSLDPLIERSRHLLEQPDPGVPPFLWPDGDDIWVGWKDSATRWSDDGPTGETVSVDAGPQGLRSLRGTAPILAGRAIARDSTHDDIVVIDLATGHALSSGLPGGGFQTGWTADGAWVLASDQELRRGTPESGWWAEPLPSDRPIAEGGMRLGAMDLWFATDPWFGEPMWVPVGRDADGVDHFADLPMEAGPDVWKTGETWRLVSAGADRVVVTTVLP